MPTMILELMKPNCGRRCIDCGRRMHSGVTSQEIGIFWLGLYVSSQVKQCQLEPEQTIVSAKLDADSLI
jgi:hypothetical protein